MAKMEKVAVYINNISFSGYLEQRGFAAFDIQNFPRSLQSIGFEFVQNKDENCFDNVKSNEIDNIVEKTKEKCGNASMLFVIISSHGREFCSDTGGQDKEYCHQVAFSNGEWVDTKEIIQKFDSCIDSNKSKIFIIQACSRKTDVDRQDKGITLTLTQEEPKQDLSGYRKEAGDGEQSRGVVVPVCVKNSVVVFTSASGLDSYVLEAPHGGGWFCIEFVSQLENEEEEFSLLEFLERVNRKMSYRLTSSDSSEQTLCKAVATITHKLTSDIQLKKIEQKNKILNSFTQN